MATLRPSYLARKRARKTERKTETTSRSAHEAAAEHPPCVHMRVPSSAPSRPRSLRPHEGNRSPSGGNLRRGSTRPADHSTSRHDRTERIYGFSSAALEPQSQPATHAPPSQQPCPSTPECKERNHRYQCRSGWAGRVMRSTVHEARQGEAREPMRVRWLLRTARSRRLYVPAAECCQKRRTVPPIALEHEMYMHVGNQHHVNIDRRLDFTRQYERTRGRLMAACDRAW